MKIFYALVVTTLAALVGCSNFAKTKSDKNSVEKISYAAAVPLFDPETNEQIRNEDTIFFYFTDNIIVRQESELHSYYKEEDTHSDADTVNMSLVSEKYLSNFFVYKKDSKYGFYTDSIGVGKILLRDSFLNKKFIQYEHPRNFKNDWQLLSVFKDKDQLREEYASIKTNPISLKKDTLLLSFDKNYRDIKLSISPFLDSLYSSKIYDFRFIVSTYYDSALKVKIPRQEVYIKLEKQKVTEAEIVFINMLLEKYKNAVR